MRIRADNQSWLTIGLAIFGVYFAIAHVYWIPGLGSTSLVGLDVIKLMLFLLAAMLMAVNMTLDKRAVLGIWQFVSLACLFLSPLSSLLAHPGGILSHWLYVAPGVGVFIMYAMAYRSRPEVVLKSLALAFLVTAALSFLHVFAVLVGYSPPSPFYEDYALGDFQHTAFGATRTGWSGAISLFAPLSLLVRRHNIKQKLLVLIGLMAIFLSQLLVGGRAGLVGFLLFFIFMARFRDWAWGVPLTIGAVGALALGLDLDLLQHLRVDSLENGAVTTATLDTFSSGRVDHYAFALFEAIPEVFLVGKGIDQAFYRDTSQWVHSVYLRAWIEGGIIHFFFITGCASMLVFLSVRNIVRLKIAVRTRDLELKAACGFVVVLGLLNALLEPAAILYNFQTNAGWWAAAAILSSNGRWRSPSEGGEWEREVTG